MWHKISKVNTAEVQVLASPVRPVYLTRARIIRHDTHTSADIETA